MGVRRTINRYRTPPSGYDYADVLKRGKRFYRNSGEFEMKPFKSPGKDTVCWYAVSFTPPPFIAPQGTRKYKFNYHKNKWEEVL